MFCSWVFWVCKLEGLIINKWAFVQVTALLLILLSYLDVVYSSSNCCLFKIPILNMVIYYSYPYINTNNNQENTDKNLRYDNMMDN